MVKKEVEVMSPSLFIITTLLSDWNDPLMCRGRWNQEFAKGI